MRGGDGGGHARRGRAAHAAEPQGRGVRGGSGAGEVPVRTKGELRAFLREVAQREDGEGRANGDAVGRGRGKRPAV